MHFHSLVRHYHTPVGGLSLLCAGIMSLPAPILAQSGTDQDTRLRIEHESERRNRRTEAQMLEDAESDGRPTSLEIDGTRYAVADTVDETGQALYIAIGQRQWRDVRRFLNAYHRFPDRDPMLVAYAEGALAREDGRLAQAERQYRALVAIKADFLPGQLELARVLFENRKDREAKQVFEGVRTQLLSDGERSHNIIRTVDAFLAALERRRGWQGSIAIGPGYSSNLNQSSASYTCLFAAPDGTCLFDRKVPDPIKAIGLNFEAMLGRAMPLSGHHGLRLSTMAFGDIYPQQHDYSQATAIARIGYQYQTARDTLSLSPSFDLGTLGSALLYDAPGVNVEWTHAMGNKAMLRLEGNYRDFRYRSRAFTAQNGPLSDISLTGWYVLPHGFTLFGGPDFSAKTTPAPVNAFDQWGVRLGVSKAFGNTASLLLISSYRYRRHRAYSEVFAAQRDDDMYNLIAIARFPALGFAGLTPELVAQYNRVESNIDWLYSYKRTAISLRLSHGF